MPTGDIERGSLFYVKNRQAAQSPLATRTILGMQSDRTFAI